ncbi:unnamed protein product, partial [marine sediment metagenome]
MLSYIIRRIMIFIPLLIMVSMISFVIIQLPPGDYLTTYIMQLKMQGLEASDAQVAQMSQQYGLGKPLYVQYFMWMRNILFYGNFGRSFQWQRPVIEVISERIALTMVISIAAIIFTWAMAIPIGVYSA